MPLSAQFGGGNAFTTMDARRLFGSTRNVVPTGADVSIAYSCAAWDSINNRMLVAGDTSYVGSMLNARAVRTTQFATLPSTVIPNNTIRFLSVNLVDPVFAGSIYVQSGATTANIARTYDGGASWVSISAGLQVGNYDGVFPWRNQLIANCRSLATNIDISADNGATWAPFSTGRIPNGFNQNMFSNPNQDIVIQTGALGIATNVNDSLAAGWTVFDFNAMFAGFVGINGYTCGDVSADGQKIVVCAQSGSIIISADGGLTWALYDDATSPFRGNAGQSPATCKYIAAVDAFVFLMRGATSMIGMFCPAETIGDLNNGITMQPAATIAANATFDRNYGASDGVNIIQPASSGDIFNTTLFSYP